VVDDDDSMTMVSLVAEGGAGCTLVDDESLYIPINTIVETRRPTVATLKPPTRQNRVFLVRRSVVSSLIGYCSFDDEVVTGREVGMIVFVLLSLNASPPKEVSISQTNTVYLLPLLSSIVDI
jgi:hypothetical protein